MLKLCCPKYAAKSKKIWNTLSAGTLAIQLMLKEEPFFFDRFPKTGRRIALNLNE